jgi:hypothetical protein
MDAYRVLLVDTLPSRSCENAPRGREPGGQYFLEAGSPLAFAIALCCEALDLFGTGPRIGLLAAQEIAPPPSACGASEAEGPDPRLTPHYSSRLATPCSLFAQRRTSSFR